MSVLLRGVRLYGEGDRVDVLVDDGQIAEIGAGLPIPDTADVIDATGHVLLPGLVDLHTHLREPGREYAEDIETGSAAAALGGYTAVFAMANTNPVADSPVVTDHVWHRGQQVGTPARHPHCAEHELQRGQGRREPERRQSRLGDHFLKLSVLCISPATWGGM